MNRSTAYSIPVKGMILGQHQYQFALDGTFFENIENAPVRNCEIDVLLEADRRHDMITLSFTLDGVVICPCDRCLATIRLPVHGQFEMIAKLEEDEAETEADDEVVIINREAPRLDLDGLLYDFVCLSVPMVRIYDCEEEDPAPCDLETRKYLEQRDKGPEQPNPIWEEIKTKLS